MASEVERVSVLLVEGVEGPSLYIDDHRVAGPKPWGGGRVVREWQADRADLLRALRIGELGGSDG